MILARLSLDDLTSGLPTLTSAEGASLAEKALYCLSQHHHQPGVEAIIDRDLSGEITIDWNLALDTRAEYSYRDLDEATEYGATAIAILFSVTYMSYNTVERSVKGTGFDYWIGNYDDSVSVPFSRSARLEISGIYKGTLSILRSRFSTKIKQIGKSDSTQTPKIVFVFEFSNPAAAIKVSP